MDLSATFCCCEKKCLPRKTLLFLTACVFTVLVVLTLQPKLGISDYYPYFPNRTAWVDILKTFSLREISEREKPDRLSLETEVKSTGKCDLPLIDPFDSSIIELIEKHSPINCEKGFPSIVTFDGNELKMDKVKIKRIFRSNSVNFCKYQSHSMTPGSDFKTSRTNWSQPFNPAIKIQPGEEHFIIECYGKGNSLIAKTYLSVVREKPELEKILVKNYQNHIHKNSPRETLSVIIFGLDGMSRPNLIRTLPKTRAYLVDTMKAFELTKHSKTGMNTFPNVMTLLTGKTDKEHSSYWNLSKHFDDIDFIWDEYEQAGYQTQLVLDTVNITSFHCSKLGFSKPPVAFYNRPTVIAAEEDDQVRNLGLDCIGDKAEVTLLSDYLLQIASTFNHTDKKPYFSYSFFTRLTHDNANKAAAGDEQYMNFFKALYERRMLHNTVFIFFSDHGPRFGPLRRTFIGMLEERMPFCFLVLPSWFLEKYPDVTSNIWTNTNRLTSHFDIHATLRHILYFDGRGRKVVPKLRGISLFHEIPENRTCEEAGINFQWCPCNQKMIISKNEVMVKQLAYEFAQKLSDQTILVRQLCHQLNLKSIKSAMIVRTDSTSHTNEDSILYQITIETTPGRAIFEGMLEFSSNTNETRIVGTVLRLNMFQTQAQCVSTPSLKPFCYCKNLDSP